MKSCHTIVELILLLGLNNWFYGSKQQISSRLATQSGVDDQRITGSLDTASQHEVTGISARQSSNRDQEVKLS